MKIIFIGHPGSGKTHAADILSQKTHIEKVDIDTLFDKHPLYFLSRSSYRKALHALLKDKHDWIIDGYHGRRMPDSIWKNADVIAFINIPKAELKQNILHRYKHKKSNKDSSHWQATFANVLKNMGQIYLLDKSLHRSMSRIKSIAGSGTTCVELKSKQDIDRFIDTQSSAR